MIVTLLLQGVKTKEWPRPCFCRGSSVKTNVTLLVQRINILKNNCDFASTGSQKSKNGQDLAFAWGQVPNTNVTLLLQGINISKRSYDFASTRSQKVKKDQDLELEGHETII